MKIAPFKGRHIDYTRPVKIYKNLHNGMFSIKQNTLVVGHCEQFVLSNPTYKVNEKARQTVIETRQKNVHSFLVGHIWEQQEEVFINNDKLFKGGVSYEIRENLRISYNPYSYNYFYFSSTKEKLNLTNDNIIIGCNKIGIFVIQ